MEAYGFYPIGSVLEIEVRDFDASYLVPADGTIVAKKDYPDLYNHLTHHNLFITLSEYDKLNNGVDDVDKFALLDNGNSFKMPTSHKEISVTKGVYVKTLHGVDDKVFLDSGDEGDVMVKMANGHFTFKKATVGGSGTVGMGTADAIEYPTVTSPESGETLHRDDALFEWDTNGKHDPDFVYEKAREEEELELE